MTIVHQTQYSTVHAGDCLDVLKDLPDESVHAVITDPPYGLSNTTPAQVTECLREWATGNTTFVPAKRGGFMGKDWDSFVPPPAVWAECFRVLKPGGHLLAFAGSRTQDLMGMSVRMAGFDIRDSFAWLYGSGFPKSHDVGRSTGDEQWEGWGTALKPAFEPVIMARKPFPGTVAANVLEHGTGAINIDASRIGTEDTRRTSNAGTNGEGWGMGKTANINGSTSGRFPANVLLDESQAAALDEQAPVTGSWSPAGKSYAGSPSSGSHLSGLNAQGSAHYGDSGGASRFFYVAKAPKAERPNVDGVAHPTVKPLTLLRYLVRMVTPPGGTVLDPFAGSGTTLEAATQEGFTSIGIEAHPDYLPLIAHRLERTQEPEEAQPARNHTAA